MSKSEKMKYMTARPIQYNINQHMEALEKILAALPDKGHLTTLKEYAVHDCRLFYKMLARFLPFSHLQHLELVQGFIIDEKDGEDIITEDGEMEVARLTDVLMQRAGNFKEVNEFIKAAELAFAVILAVEPEIPNVYDEGWTYQCILDDAFEFMTEMVAEIENVKIIEKLHEMTLDHFDNRDPDDSHWEHQFQDLLKILSN